MKREKTIGFNYYPYKTAKHKEYNDNGEEVFPVYMNVNFSGKSTKFPLVFGDKEMGIEKVKFSENEINDGIRDSILIKNIENILTSIIRYESKIVGEKYKVAGIKYRLDIYTSLLDDILEDMMIEILDEFLGDYITHNEYLKIDELYHLDETEYSFPSSEYSFFIRYKYFDTNSFRIKKNMPEQLKLQVVSFLAIVLFRSKFRGDDGIKMLLQWMLGSKLKTELRDFINSGSMMKAAKVLEKSDDNFQFVYRDFKEDIKNVKFETVQSTIENLIRQTFSYKDIMASLEKMKKKK